MRSILTPSSKLRNAVQELTWGQKVIFLLLQWLGLSCPSIHASVLLFYMVQVLLPREGNLGLSYQPDLWDVLVHFRPSEA